MDRANLRTRLIHERMVLPEEVYNVLNAAITNHFTSKFDFLRGDNLGLFWPIKREYNSLPLMEILHRIGSTISLPVIRGKILAFRKWYPGVSLGSGILDIPYPLDTPYVKPMILVIPLVGFDDRGFRLGYGAGYYDNTLQDMEPSPIRVGVGFELSHIDSIQPHFWDIPMELIVTEKGVRYYHTEGSEWIRTKTRLNQVMEELLYLHFGILVKAPNIAH